MSITSAFGYHSTAQEVLEGIDLSGITALVTGAASGIGVETARALALAGAAVTIAVRDEEAGSRTAAAIIAESPSAEVAVLRLDLADQSQIRGAADEWLEVHHALDILINNAGVMACPLERTTDGFENQFGTNHLGHFTLFARLLPALRAADGARVVALSSSAHRRSDLVLDDLNYEGRNYDPWEAYGQSKTANALFAVELSERYGGEGIWANAVMPGGILTGLQRHMSVEAQREAGFIDADGTPNALFKNVEQGASTSVWAATAPQLDGVGGLYLENCAEAGVMDLEMPFMGRMDYAVDPMSAARLWEASTVLTGELG
jgi:NAD(P)-dependent dehydrogenase (short-subunit alcohol dehydrogenase family)